MSWEKVCDKCGWRNCGTKETCDICGGALVNNNRKLNLMIQGRGLDRYYPDESVTQCEVMIQVTEPVMLSIFSVSVRHSNERRYIASEF